MADREHRGLVARWLEGKERSEDYARSTLPTNRFSLFWDILKGRFGRLMLVNLLVLITCLPLIAVVVYRYLSILSQDLVGPFGSGFLTGYPVIPDVIGLAELNKMRSDIFFFAVMIPASAIAALGISGGMYIIRNLIWTQGVFVANDFVRGIKRNYFCVLEALLIFTVILFVAQFSGNLADWYATLDSPYSGWLMASKVVGYIILSFMLLVCLWMISLGVNYKQSPWALFRNAVVMTVGTFPQTVVFAAAAIAPIFLVLFSSNRLLLSIGIVFYLLIGFSYFMLVWMDYSQWAFDKFVNPNMGFAVGRGLYQKDGKKQTESKESAPADESGAMREYRRMILAHGKSELIARPIRPIDEGPEIYQLPESFSREDLRRLKESRLEMEEDVKKFEEEHKNDEQYVEYNRQFEERERALPSEGGKKKKKVKPPKMLNKR